jgi:hypothetical protein
MGKTEFGSCGLYERIVYTDTGYGEYIGWTGFRCQCFTNVSQWQVHAACFEGPDVAP